MSKKYVLIVGVGIVIIGACTICLTILGLRVVTIEPVRTILFSNPTTYEDYNHRADAYYTLGQYKQANIDYTKAIELNPNYAEAYYNRGNTYIFLREYEQAIADYTKTTKLNPQHANAWGYLCWFGSLLGHAKDVMDACERGVELDPDNGGIRDSRGLARALIGDYKGAIEQYLRQICQPVVLVSY